MNRYLLSTVLASAALAGCVRGNVEDVRNEAPRNDAVAAAAVRPVEESPVDAAPARTGSRLLPSADALADPVITAKIKAGILADPQLQGADISVTTSQGVVNLTGSIVSQEQAAVASAYAQREDGVMRVDNHLAVTLR